MHRFVTQKVEEADTVREKSLSTHRGHTTGSFTCDETALNY
jgi:hypothetical protein